MRNTGVAAALLASLLAACSDLSEGDSRACPAKLVATLSVTFRRDVPTATVLLDGAPASLLLDLGAPTSVLSEDVVERLHLSRDPTALPTISGVGGSNTRWAARVGRVTLGGLVLDDKRMEVAPIAMAAGPGSIDGSLGLDVLRKYDVDWDLPNRQLKLYSASECDGPPTGWPVAVRVPLHHPSTSGGDPAGPRLLLLPALVDGQAVTALLDSGTGLSLVDPATAARVEGSGDGSGPPVTLSGIGSDTATGHLRRFRRLTVGGETQPGWPMVVAPVPAWAGEMILGSDYLSLHRAWLPAGGSAIWFAPSAKPPSSPGA